MTEPHALVVEENSMNKQLKDTFQFVCRSRNKEDELKTEDDIKRVIKLISVIL